MTNYDEFYQATFISPKQYCGFQSNQNYTIKITENKPYGVILTVLGDDEFQAHCPYCNLVSVERAWKINKEKGEMND